MQGACVCSSGSESQISYAAPLTFAADLYPEKVCHNQLPVARDPPSLSHSGSLKIVLCLLPAFSVTKVAGNSISVVPAAASRWQVTGTSLHTVVCLHKTQSGTSGLLLPPAMPLPGIWTPPSKPTGACLSGMPPHVLLRQRNQLKSAPPEGSASSDCVAAYWLH